MSGAKEAACDASVSGVWQVSAGTQEPFATILNKLKPTPGKTQSLAQNGAATPSEISSTTAASGSPTDRLRPAVAWATKPPNANTKANQPTPTKAVVKAGSAPVEAASTTETTSKTNQPLAAASSQKDLKPGETLAAPTNQEPSKPNKEQLTQPGEAKASATGNVGKAGSAETVLESEKAPTGETKADQTSSISTQQRAEEKPIRVATVGQELRQKQSAETKPLLVESAGKQPAEQKFQSNKSTQGPTTQTNAARAEGNPSARQASTEAAKVDQTEQDKPVTTATAAKSPPQTGGFDSDLSGTTAVAQTPTAGTASTSQSVQTAPQAAAASTANSPDSAVSSQIAQALRASVVRAGEHVVVRMHPPELGRVRVTFEAEGKELRAVLQADSIRTLSVLQREAPALFNRLADSGIQLKRMDFVLNEQSNEQTGSEGSLQAHNGNGSQRQGANQQVGTEPNDTLTDEQEPPEGAETQPVEISDESINVWI